jgi:WD40 repeat protein
MWDGRTGSEIAVPGAPLGVRAIVTTADSRWLALSRWGDTIVGSWDLDSGAQLHRIEVEHREEVQAIAMSADGALVATAGGRYDPWLKIWYTATGRLKCAMKTEHDGIETVTFLGNGRTVATTGGQMDHAVGLWDAMMGQPFGSPMRGDALGVLALAASPNGNWVATGDQDDSVADLDPDRSQRRA